MGLFSFFKRDRVSPNATLNGDEQPEIPKDIFVDESEPQESSAQFHTNGFPKGVEALYAFLQADYESRGYNDALVNPDESYKSDNISLMKHDLQILIQRANTYYEDLIKELDFHINSRSRAGLIDLVEALKFRKEMVVEHMAKVGAIERELETNQGMSRRIILSYQRGFMRGLSALTQSNVLNKEL